jgi:HAE1 family hydrophobic/amphiphilic exporter-1
MTLIQSSVKLPHTVVVATLLCAIFGYLAMKSIPVQLTPTVDEPEIQVNTVYRGASPQEVEDQITDPIEEAMEAVTGIDRITSNSAEGRSSVTLEFDWGADKDAAMIDVINKLSQVTSLPEDAESSEVISVTSDQQGAIIMAAHYEDLRALMASWRYLHRWVALAMVLLLVAHVVTALRVGGLFARAAP